jgi:molecular chaperone GrpE
MESEKVEEIKVAPKKDLLNSDYHQVIEEVENNDLPSGTVLEVMQKGYLLDKQLLKPVRVKVSKKVGSEEKK